MEGIRRAGKAGCVGERGKADAASPAHDDEALSHESTVEPGQRNDVGNGGERDEIEACDEIRLRPPRKKTALPQFAIECDEREEDDACRAKMPEA